MNQCQKLQKETLEKQKEADNNETTYSLESIIEKIQSTDFGNLDSRVEMIRIATNFFKEFSIDSSENFNETIDFFKNVLLEEEITIEKMNFFAILFNLVIQSISGAHNLDFLEYITPILTRLLSTGEEDILISVMAILEKLSHISIEYIDFIISNILESNNEQFNQILENILKTNDNPLLIHNVILFYTEILTQKMNDFPVDLMQSAFACISSLIPKALPSFDPESLSHINNESKEIIIDILNFLEKSSFYDAWYPLFVSFNLLEFINIILIYIKGTRFKVTVLKVIQEYIKHDSLSCDPEGVENEELLFKTKINIEKIIELLQHRKPLISHQALQCISSFPENIFQIAQEKYGLAQNLAQLFPISPFKIKESIIELIDKHSSVIDWFSLYSDEFFTDMLDLMPNVNARTKRRILFIIQRTLEVFNSSGIDVDSIRSNLLENGIEDMLIELIDNPVIQQSRELLNDSNRLLTILTEEA